MVFNSILFLGTFFFPSSFFGLGFSGTSSLAEEEEEEEAWWRRFIHVGCVIFYALLYSALLCSALLYFVLCLL